MATPLQPIAPNLWLLEYPLKMLGVDLHRNVAVIRLASGKLIIHSTAPFSPEDVAAITALGEPAWIIDTLLRHDTFALEGRKAFPSAAYLAPEGFAAKDSCRTEPLIPPPSEWSGEVDVLAIEGAPAFGEVVVLHRPSRTLIVADLVFNFPGEQRVFKKLLLKLAAVGGRHDPGITLPFKKAITDKAAYLDSVRKVLSWDFDRIIVGHGVPVESGGKEKLRLAIENAGIGKL